MNRRRTALIFGLAAVLGLVAAYLSADYVRSGDSAVVPVAAKRTQAVVALRDLPLGAVVTAQDIRLVDWPSDVLPAGFATRPEEVIGRGVITALVANEPLLQAKLADKASGGGLSIVIPEGMRAMSVRVDEVVGVAGFVVPGTSVDVIVTVVPPGNNQERTSRVILQNVRTLASGQTIQRDGEGKPITATVITLLVNPEEAESLALAANEGRIQLALRNTLDLEPVRTSGARVANLVTPGRSPAAAGARPAARTAPAPANRPSVVEMYSGGQRTLRTF
jgi:pilus assembly protein CpaB